MFTGDGTKCSTECIPGCRVADLEPVLKAALSFCPAVLGAFYLSEHHHAYSPIFRCIFFFFLGGRDIHYKDAMKETSVCEGHPQQKLQATRTT